MSNLYRTSVKLNFFFTYDWKDRSLITNTHTDHNINFILNLKIDLIGYLTKRAVKNYANFLKFKYFNVIINCVC